MTQPECYDAIVVGAGPAGAAFTLHAQRLGVRVLLLDKARFPRDKTCGDALSGRSVVELDRLDLLPAVRSLPGAAIRRLVFGSPAGDTVSVALPPPARPDPTRAAASAAEGYVVPRLHLDALLFDRAQAVACRCETGLTVHDLGWQEGRATGIGGVNAEGQAVRFRGRVVVGADGFSSVVARRAGLYAHDPQHWMVALRCYYEGVAGLDDQIELHFVDEALPGYLWLFPAGQGRANVGIGMNHADLKRRGIDLRQALARALALPRFAARMASARPLERPVGWNLPVGSQRRTACGEGLMLIGDAAGLIDPFTGEGIGNSLLSARVAADTVAQACQADDVSVAFLRRYEEAVWTALGPELSTSARMRRLARRRWLVNLVIRRAARRPEISAAMSAMLLDPDDRRRLLDLRFYLGLLFG
jgi:geranylgeranyl reductase family protein